MLFSAALRKKVQEPGQPHGTPRRGDTGARPALRAAAPLTEPVTAGLLLQTQIATARGWLPVARLQPGDMVLTFDHGARPLVDLVPFETDDAARPVDEHAVLVPAGALENRSPLVLMPGQGVLLDCDQAEEMFGDPFVLLPAAALIGLRGIAPAEMPQQPGLCPRFARDQIIYAHGSALLLCPGVAPSGPGGAATAPLPIGPARDLVERLIAEEQDAPPDRVTDGSAI